MTDPVAPVATPRPRPRLSGCVCVPPWLAFRPLAATALSAPSPTPLVADAAPPPPPWARADEGDDEAADRRERHHLAGEHHGQASGLHDPHETQGKAIESLPVLRGHVIWNRSLENMKEGEQS